MNKIALNLTDQELGQLKGFLGKAIKIVDAEAHMVAGLAARVRSLDGREKIAGDLETVAAEYQGWITAAVMGMK